MNMSKIRIEKDVRNNFFDGTFKKQKIFSLSNAEEGLVSSPREKFGHTIDY